MKGTQMSTTWIAEAKASDDELDEAWEVVVEQGQQAQGMRLELLRQRAAILARLVTAVPGTARTGLEEQLGCLQTRVVAAHRSCDLHLANAIAIRDARMGVAR
jgi:hypothetical protein